MPEHLKYLVEHLEPEAVGIAAERLMIHLRKRHGGKLSRTFGSETRAWANEADALQTEVRNLLNDQPGILGEPGSASHLLMGKLMEQQDSRDKNRVPHGGLVRILKEEKLADGRSARNKYLWVCGDCRKEHYDYSLRITPGPGVSMI